MRTDQQHVSHEPRQRRGRALLAAVLLLAGCSATGSDGSAAPELSSSASASARPTDTASPRPSPTPTASASATPTPRPTPGAAALAWEISPEQPEAHDIVWLDDAWLGLGGIERRAAIWSSPDGMEWSELPAIDPVGSPPTSSEHGTSYRISSIIRFNAQLVAFGVHAWDCCDRLEAVFWTSSDGRRWTLHTPDSFGANWHYPVKALVRGDRLFLLSGTQLGGGFQILSSSDLRTWHTELISESSPEMQWQSMADIADGDGLLIAVGARHHNQPTVWVGAEAGALTPRSGPSDAKQLRAIEFDAASGQFIVGGDDDSGRARIWTTRDGEAWSSIVLAEVGTVLDVAAADGLIAAAGLTGAHPSATGTVWTSFGGTTFASAELAQTESIERAATNGSQVVVRGHHYDEATYTTTTPIWIGGAP